MAQIDTPPDWGIHAAVKVETTAIATVYRVQSAWGPAALKCFHNGDAKNEANAPIWLRHMAGFGAVEVLADTPAALLLRWLDGPRLGDISRAGEDDKATDILGDVAARLLRAPPLTDARFPTLSEWVTPMLAMPAPAWLTRDQYRQFEMAKDTARALLASPSTPRLMHGDLHHDNILHGAGCWRVIDPKGVLGDPAYEVANCFPNPVGFGMACDPARITRMRRCLARKLAQPEARIHGWAVVKSALSFLWNDGKQAAQAGDLAMLAALLDTGAADPANY